MRVVRLSTEAEVELRLIWAYIAEKSGSTEIADDQAESIIECLLLFGNNPYMGRRRDEVGKDVRSFPSGDYVIFYEIESDSVHILHVLHGSRNLTEFFGE